MTDTATTDFLLGAYDAKTCPERLRKALHPSYADIPLDPVPSGVIARRASGVEFEAFVRNAMRKAMPRQSNAVLSGDRTPESLARREAETLRLMRSGDVLAIWNPRLPADPAAHRAGEPDVLLWAGSDGGTLRWVPVDVKDHRVLEGTRSVPVTASTLKRPMHHKARLTELGPGTPRRSDALQLAHYYRMLQGTGHATATPVGGIIGRELLVLWHDLDADLYDYDLMNGTISAMKWYDLEFAIRVRIAADALAQASQPNPQWHAECASCEFRTVCRDELREADHLTLLAGITPARARAHINAGIDTVGKLATLDHRTALLVDAGVDVRALRDWAKDVPAGTPASGFTRRPSWHAALAARQVATAADALGLHAGTAQYRAKVWNLAGSIDQARVAKSGKVHRARGVDQVAFRPASVEQDFDLEDYHGYVYLIGVRDTHRRTRDGKDTTRGQYTAFANWDGTEGGEARVLAEFWAHVTAAQAGAHDTQHGYRAYHYSHHEPATLARLALRHAGRPGVPTVEQVQAWFASRDVVDLYSVVSRDLVWPTESVSLKDVAKWVRFSWRDSDPSGSSSMAWYEQAIGGTDPGERDAFRSRLLDYNADDCHAQTAVRDWLSRLGQARAPGASLPSVGALDKRFARGN
jgi:hypothetical protein